MSRRRFSLPRASTVCKSWHSILSDPRFLYRFRKHHQKPPLIGFFDKQLCQAPIFTPMLDPPNRIPVSFTLPENLLAWKPWTFFGCRHGIALFLDRPCHEAALWDPYTNFQRRIAFPPGFDNQQASFIMSAAVLCSAGDEQHVHGDCHLSPFKLLLACHDTKCTKAFVCTYESMSGIWEDGISIATTYMISRNRLSILVRNALCLLLRGGGILEFDFERLTLDVIEKPASVDVTNCFGIDWSFQIIRGEDNGRGNPIVMVLSHGCYRKLSNWMSSLHDPYVQAWQNLSNWMPGYDEDTNVIFLSSVSHDFILQLE